MIRLSLLALWAFAAFGDGVLAASPELISAHSVWRYHDGTGEPGAGWRGAAFDDLAWSSGQAELGYGDGDEATIIGFGAEPGDKPITTYFRRRFEVSNSALIRALRLRIRCDDGAVVYLNGNEIARVNMPAGEITRVTPAASVLNPPFEGQFSTLLLPPSGLVAGGNVLAVEVHQSDAATDDLSFDLELIAATGTPASFVTRGPYLQAGAPNQITLRWRTDAPVSSRVDFGVDSPDVLPQHVSDATETTEHSVTLTGLQPATRYFYAIGTATDRLAGGDETHFFRTSPAVGIEVPVHFWIIGDAGTAGDGSRRAESVRDAYLRSSFGATGSDGWLMLGDNAYYVGTDAEYQRAVFDTYPELLRNTVLWPTLGNHDWYTESGAPYYSIFDLPTAGQSGGTPSGTEHYYSFDYANIHFVCLDSQDSSRLPGSPMLTWLESDLASTTQKWIIAFWHHPPYSKGSHDSDLEVELVEMRQHALPILEAGGVDLVLGGHSHCYERSILVDGHYGTSDTLAAPMKKDAGDGRESGDGAYGKDPVPHAGTIYSVIGSSGQISGGALNHPVMVTSLSILGSAVLDVHGDRLDMRFLDATGAVIDHYTISKAPLVTLSAPQPILRELDAQGGSITLSRTRGLNQPLQIALTLDGTATPNLTSSRPAPQ